MKRTSLIPVLTLILSMANNAYAESNGADEDLMRADANQDGKVSFAEFEAAHHQAMVNRFKSKDINQDGFIDLEEKVVAKKQKQAEKQLEKKAEKKALREKYQEDRKRRKKHFFKYH